MLSLGKDDENGGGGGGGGGTGGGTSGVVSVVVPGGIREDSVTVCCIQCKLQYVPLM